MDYSNDNIVGVLKAVDNVNKIIAPAIMGKVHIKEDNNIYNNNNAYM